MEIAKRKGLYGHEAEKYFAELEKKIADELKEYFDGVVLYHTVGDWMTPVQVFQFS